MRVKLCILLFVLVLIGLSVTPSAQVPIINKAEPRVGAQLAESIPLIQADRVHQELGYRGSGIGILVIDDFGKNTGITPAHGAIVEDIILAVAPGVTIWKCDAGFINIFGFPGIDTEGRGMECLQWAVQNRITKNIRGINMSYGSGVCDEFGNCEGIYTSPCSPGGRHDDLLMELHQLGVTVVAASGNQRIVNGMGTPACLPAVISVGAVYDGPILLNIESEGICGFFETGATDKVTCYSNTARFLDLLAPGSRIAVPGLTDAFFCLIAEDIRNCLMAFSGTSWAAPHVTGIVALMLEANPALRPEEIRDVLRKTGKPIAVSRTGASGETFQYTISRVDAYQAVVEALRLTRSSRPALPPIEPTPGNRSVMCPANSFISCARTSPSQVKPAQVFMVTLTIETLGDLTLLGLREQAPAGFLIVSAEAHPTADSLVVEPDHLRVAFGGNILRGRRFIINYELIAASTSGNFLLQGFMTTSPFSVVSLISEIYVASDIARSDIAQFDTDRSWYIEDAEFFAAIDQWLAGSISNDLFFQVVDAWIGHVRVASVKKVHNTSQDLHIFDLSGQLISTQPCSYGRQELRAQKALSESDVPIGTYILVIRDCTTGKIEIKKVAKMP